MIIRAYVSSQKVLRVRFLSNFSSLKVCVDVLLKLSFFSYKFIYMDLLLKTISLAKVVELTQDKEFKIHVHLRNDPIFI